LPAASSASYLEPRTAVDDTHLMIHDVEVKTIPLDDYAAVAHLSRSVAELRAQASVLAPELAGRTVWMVSSTARGGGVAEMMPREVAMLRELGVDTRWAVIDPAEPEFFPLTKRLHNLIHGSGEPQLSAADRTLYDRASAQLAAELLPRLADGDVLVVHDPQPLGAGARMRSSRRITAVWRCHIGIDDDLPQTRAAWDFLAPDLAPYDRALFTAAEYVPPQLSGSASIVHPALDPLSHKNRELGIHKLVGILVDAKLVPEHGPAIEPPFEHPALRLQPDGTLLPALLPEEIGLLFRPIVLQVSRWDRLKGWRPLLEGFVQLKRALPPHAARYAERQHRMLSQARLVLAGPDPASIHDDPEATEVFTELCGMYASLEPDLQRDVVLLALPMASLKENALIVNALQRCATLVVQNSLREGFGLTVTEAMWKRCAVLASPACGLRQQIRHGVDGHLLTSAEDPHEIADTLELLLTSPRVREAHGRAAQLRVQDEFLVFTQVRRWLEVFTEVVRAAGHSG
jgi:trehalose synthase